MVKFLSNVKVKRFATSVKKWGNPPFESMKFKAHFRVINSIENKNPDVVYTVIGVSNLQEGYSDYLGSDEGYVWVQKKLEKVYIVANTLGRRFKVLPHDLEEIVSEPHLQGEGAEL